LVGETPYPLTLCVLGVEQGTNKFHACDLRLQYELVHLTSHNWTSIRRCDIDALLNSRKSIWSVVEICQDIGTVAKWVCGCGIETSCIVEVITS
jgi:hypothetical protein